MSALSDLISREHQYMPDGCTCGDHWAPSPETRGSFRPHVEHVVEVTKAEVRKALAEQMGTKAALFRATRDEMLRAIFAHEPHDFDADDIIRYAAYTQAWESAARMARGES